MNRLKPIISALSRVRAIVIAVVVCLTAALASCRHDNAAELRLDAAESLMDSRPDSALIVLDSIDVSNLDGKRQRARFALLKSMALDKNYIDTTTFDVLQPAIDFYLEKGTPDERLKTYYYQGRIFQNANDPHKALAAFMRASDYRNLASDTSAICKLLVAKSGILFSMYKTDEFLSAILDAAKMYGSIGDTLYETDCLCRALDGSVLNNDRQLADSIMSVVNERISENPELNTFVEPYKISYTINFGTKDSIENLLLKFESTRGFDDNTLLAIARAYAKIGKASQAKQIIDSIDYASPITTSLNYLATKTKILEQNGDFAGALLTYKEFSATEDSIHQSIFDHELQHVSQLHENEKSNLLKVRKRDRIIRISLIAAFLMLLLSVYLYYRHRLDKTRLIMEEQENKRLLLENEKAALESERQSLAAENLRMRIAGLEEEIMSLKECLENNDNLTSQVEEVIKTRIFMLNKLLSTIISSGCNERTIEKIRDDLFSDREEFMKSTRLAFKATHPGFIEYLEKKGLTETEINYACLYAIGLRGKDVGEYLQSKRHYHISSDIRGKLGIDQHDTNLGIYIQELSHNY
ncbi:MAG: hypothetical protein K2K93_01650 [Muribaculaceae bacterium]|nr:hypothetical protein [Muribaculaceae bacterium]